jgi:hypothetical protein
VQIALDPAVSGEAQALIDRGAAEAYAKSAAGPPCPNAQDHLCCTPAACAEKGCAAVAVSEKSAAVLADAERYRFIRELDVTIYGNGVEITVGFTPEVLDSQIDAARHPQTGAKT